MTDAATPGSPGHALSVDKRGTRNGGSLPTDDDLSGALASSERPGRWIRLTSRVGLRGTAVGGVLQGGAGTR
jgi:hypothetical protein